jgi:hypothetical protein
MSQSIFPGPTAAENNPAIEPQNFQPSRFPITAISLGRTTTVTLGTAFGVSNNYVVGQLVRFLIPPAYGTRQLNEQQGYVISLPSSTQVEVDINTSIGYDTFIASPTYGPTKPSMLAIGDINSGIQSSTGRNIPTTTIPGAFINISPQ